MKKLLERGRRGTATTKLGLILLVGWLIVSCGPNERDPGLPDYLLIPSSLAGYAGSGQVTLSGGRLQLHMAGPEQLNSSTKTYSGVGGRLIGDDVVIYFTDGQPLAYRDRSQVPADLKAFGELSLYGNAGVGTYPLGGQAAPSPRGEIADLTLNLPGPQLYVANSGTLTINQNTLVRSEGDLALHRLTGSFRASMYADGPGLTAGERTPTLEGTFDVLLVKTN
jgi:hypothetical protein